MTDDAVAFKDRPRLERLLELLVDVKTVHADDGTDLTEQEAAYLDGVSDADFAAAHKYYERLTEQDERGGLVATLTRAPALNFKAAERVEPLLEYLLTLDHVHDDGRPLTKQEAELWNGATAEDVAAAWDLPRRQILADVNFEAERFRHPGSTMTEADVDQFIAANVDARFAAANSGCTDPDTCPYKHPWTR
jgi:hypothetical protein